MKPRLARSKQSLVGDRIWPDPEVRERQLFGVSMRTTGFGQGDRGERYPQSVESRCGAVAAVKLVGHHQLSGTGRSASPQLRLHIPLIEPDMQISRIRLSDKTSRPHPRPAVLQVGQSHEPEVPVEV